MRFTSSGPDFPVELLASIERGEVVVLCGAGVSAPSDLPSFKELTTDVFRIIGVGMNEAEAFAFGRARYDEALGILASRLADPRDVISAVTRTLTEKFNGNIRPHTVLSRISRDITNRTVIVTTNFDTLFERAIKADRPNTTVLSSSGQDMPPPGAADFEGIIHIHGRIGDDDLDLTATPLVLTSSQFGDAYLRSGWASRFLFDLVRCRTLLLVGYSADDVIVRYILNVLQNDRERFPEIREVYALAPCAPGTNDGLAGWGAIPVRAIPFDPANDFKALWDALDNLLEFLNGGRDWRTEILKSHLTRPLSEIQPFELDQCLEALRADASLWDEVPKLVTDPLWMKRLTEVPSLPSETTRAWILARWASLNWEDQATFDMVVERTSRLGKDFGTRLSHFLVQDGPKTPVWAKAWRLLAWARTWTKHTENDRHWLRGLFDTSDPIDLGIIALVETITPELQVTPRSASYRKHTDRPATPGLADIARFEVCLSRDRHPNALITAANENPALFERILSVSTNALEEALHVSRDAEILSDASRSVPSVEDHPQNAHRDDFMALTRLCAIAVEGLRNHDAHRYTVIVQNWSRSPFLLIKRLALNELRGEIFAIETVVDALHNLSPSDMDDAKRELMLLIQRRGNQLSAEQADTLIRQIDAAADQLYDAAEGDTFSKDWKHRAKKRFQWLFLKSMAIAGVEEVTERLRDIANADTHLDRDLEDHDYFDSYFGGGEVIGVTAELENASPEQRADLLLNDKMSRDVRRSENWPAFCRQDPEGALQALTLAGFNKDLASAWSDLLWSFSTPEPEEGTSLSEVRAKVSKASFEFLRSAPDDFLDEFCYAAVWALGFAQNHLGPDLSYWWERLWDSALRTSDDVDTTDLLTRAINSSAGRLTEMLLAFISKDLKAGIDLTAENGARLGRALNTPSPSGTLSRAILVRSIPFVSRINPSIIDELNPYLLEDGPVGAGLRTVLLAWTPLLPHSTTRKLNTALIRGASEISEGGTTAYNAAAKLLSPVFEHFHTPSDERAVSEAVVKQTLSSAPILLEAASDLFSRWFGQFAKDLDPPSRWRTVFKPAFQAVWPRDKILQQSNCSLSLAGLAIQCHDAFPEALDTLVPYIVATEANWTEAVFNYAEGLQTALKFPDEAVALMYKLYHASEDRSIFGLSKTVEALAKSHPSVAVDRRIHLLRRKATGY